MDDAVIITEGLTKIYPGDIAAVVDLNLTVERNEIFGLLGPNGAGKSTTAGMLTTRVVPTSGRAIVGGLDVWEKPAKAKRLIGVVPQTNTLDRSLTVRENLVFHGRFFGMSAASARAEADRLLTQFRLAERADARITALSGGMAQRLMVARAVMHRPAILFLDEPTAGLDPQSRLALWEVLGELHHDGQTIVLTTHYMEEADELCDRIAIIDVGRMLALDTPDGLKGSVSGSAIATVTADGDPHRLAAVLGSAGDWAIESTAEGEAVRVAVTSRAGVLPKIIDAAEAAGFSVTDISVVEPTLEDVFLTLTGKDLRE